MSEVTRGNWIVVRFFRFRIVLPTSWYPRVDISFAEYSVLGVLSRFKGSGRPLAFAKALSKNLTHLSGMLTVVSKHDKAAVLCCNRKSSERVVP